MTATTDEGKLPPRALELLAALRADPDKWFSRNDLADLTGKRTLSPNDINHLDRLVREGFIDGELRPQTVRPVWFYRAKPTEG